MKENAPEKIYINPNIESRTWLIGKGDTSFIEYIHTDAFIEKAKEFIWSHTEGSDYHVNYVLKEFEKYMKGE